MVKAPRAGAVKTRLVPPLFHAEAATLAACFAQDTIRSVQPIVTDLIVAYAPPDGRSAIEKLLKNDSVLWLEQRGEDLGARLQAATEYAASLGYGPIVVMGTDSPTLPASFIESAINSLSAGESDIALGPTDDGGYYLIGLRQYVSDLFYNIALGTPLAYEQTLRSAAGLSLRTLELPRWYDVDTASDLKRLRDEIFTSEGARAQAPATYQWLNIITRNLDILRNSR